MKLRTLLFWIHLVIGVATLLFIFIMSATGVLLTYQRQILEWYDTHDYRAAPPSPETPRLRPDQIVAAVRAERPDAAISSITFHSDPSAPAEVGIGRRTLFLNPYSGRVWGEGTDGPRPFYRVISAWHTGLGSGRESFGHTIAAASNLAVVFMVVTGFILWFPRNLSWNAVRSVLWFKRGLQSQGTRLQLASRSGLLVLASPPHHRCWARCPCRIRGPAICCFARLASHPSRGAVRSRPRRKPAARVSSRRAAGAAREDRAAGEVVPGKDVGAEAAGTWGAEAADREARHLVAVPPWT